MNAITPTATQSLGIATKRFVVEAVNDGSIARTHLAGRALPLGTALFGTVEVAARLAMYCVGQVAALFTLYQNDTINNFVADQVRGGFIATIITSASFFSTLSPSIFTTIHLPGEALVARQIEPIDEAAVERRREAEIVRNLIRLPFQMLALTFQLPFYCIYLGIQLAILPIRIALLPIQLMLCPFKFFAPQQNFRLNLV